jgi:hypothetical protein
MSTQVSDSGSDGIKSECEGGQMVAALATLLHGDDGSGSDEGFVEDSQVPGADSEPMLSKKTGAYAHDGQRALLWSVPMKAMVDKAMVDNGPYRPLRLLSGCTGMWTEGKSFQVLLSNSTFVR